MQYEFKLKQKLDISHEWEERYLCVCGEQQFEFVNKRYNEFIESQKKQDSRFEYILLVNQLDDNGDFVRVIQ